MCRIPIDAALKNGDDFVGELVEVAITMGYGSGLKAIEFVEGVVDRGVCDKMVDIVLFCS